jgi:electron transfer flavoprotein alpha subunit
VWVIAEVVEGQLSPTTLELLGGAANVAGETGGQVGAVLLGSGLDALVPQLAAHGADVVYLADDPRLAAMDPEVYTHVLSAAIQAHQPWAVLAPASADGREYTPRVAARLSLGLTGDAIGLQVKDGQLVQLKPAFGGTIVAPIVSRTSPQLATVRPGALQPRPANEARQATVVPLALDGLPEPRVRLVNRDVQAGAAALALEHAEIVVGAGAGLGGPENLSYVYELAEVLDAAVGATRRVVDSGWLPRQQQVGLTGKVLAPKLYIGVAVRGAFNHTIGIQKAGIVVAINKDPQAAIFADADFGVVGDYKEFVPALVEALAAAKAQTQEAARV